MYVLSETLLYVCFSVLMGAFVLEAIPERYKPVIQVSNNVLTIAVAGIILFTAMQVVKLVVFFMTYLDYPLGYVVFRVLRDYEVGNGFLWTVTLSAILIGLLRWEIGPQAKRIFLYLKILMLISLIIALGWSSHSKALNGWEGFFSHTSHFLALTVWIGILIVVSWFTVQSRNWEAWVRWMTPVSMVCLTITTIAGFMMMFDLAPNYRNAWVIPYGQALLVKHIIIVPLFLFAFVNSVGIPRMVKKDADLDPRSWLKFESGVALLIFVATAYMGQQSPPHDLKEALSEGEVVPSRLFALFYNGSISPDIQVKLHMNPGGIGLGILTLQLLLLTVWLIYRRKAIRIALLPLCASILTAYLAVMLSLA